MSEEPKREPLAMPRYRVTRLYDAAGQVSPHFVDEEFHSFCDTWEHAMGNSQFASVIENELKAERVADGPLAHLAVFAPNERVRTAYLDWLAFIDGTLEPWTTGGAIHFRPHWARVLIHGLSMADAEGWSDADLACIGAAASFHDSRRKNPYLDTGHGARAAHYYARFCAAQGEDAGGALLFDPRAYLSICWHDRNDEDGFDAIETAVRKNAIASAGIPDMAVALPAGAEAAPADVYRMLKDADGLDRVRLGKDGLDAHFLRTERARRAVPFARELLAASDGSDSSGDS